MFSQNFITLIDSNAQQATASITSFVSTDQADEYQKLLNQYNKRKVRLDQLKQAFTAFERSSFFGQTVVGPRADELEGSSDDIFEIFKADMQGQWGSRSEADFDAMIDAMKRDYDIKVQETIADLFPFGDIDGLYNSYSSLAAIYGLDNDEYTCQEVIGNKTVDTAGPLLMTSIEEVQQTMAIAASSVG